MTGKTPQLPPQVRAETFTYTNGDRVTVYRAPFESDGPRLMAENGARVLYYMYAAYVFRWPEGTSQVDVGHGSIVLHMDLTSGVTITGRWCPAVLAEFGQTWAADQLKRFGR
ncbi:MAG: hypothetical protein ACRDQB_03375 [Thermocrispum sp.]